MEKQDGAITLLSEYRSLLIKATNDAYNGKLPKGIATDMARLANATCKIDSNIVQRLKVRERKER